MTPRTRRTKVMILVVSVGIFVASIVTMARWSVQDYVRLAAEERACYERGQYPHMVSNPRGIVCMPLPAVSR